MTLYQWTADKLVRSAIGSNDLVRTLFHYVPGKIDLTSGMTLRPWALQADYSVPYMRDALYKNNDHNKGCVIFHSVYLSFLVGCSPGYPSARRPRGTEPTFVQSHPGTKKFTSALCHSPQGFFRGFPGNVTSREMQGRTPVQRPRWQKGNKKRTKKTEM